MSLINCEINLILTWSFECLILRSNKEKKKAKIKAGSKRITNWIKYQSKATIER